MLNLRLAAALALLLPTNVMAAEEESAKDDSAPMVFEITMKNHEFSPIELVVPADKKLKINIKNEDAAPFEFESPQLKREKIIQPGDKSSITFNELKPGTYKYYDDFNRTAKGFITVK